MALPVGARHFYEIIREGCACHLYLDIEFRRSTNRGLDGSALVAFLTVRILAAVQVRRTTAAALLCGALHVAIVAAPEASRSAASNSFVQISSLGCAQERFGIRTGLEDVIDLDSSTDAKFSRHLVVVLPGGQRFRDNQHVGRVSLAPSRTAEHFVSEFSTAVALVSVPRQSACWWVWRLRPQRRSAIRLAIPGCDALPARSLCSCSLQPLQMKPKLILSPRLFG